MLEKRKSKLDLRTIKFKDSISSEEEIMKYALILDTNVYYNFLKYDEKDEHTFYKLLPMSMLDFDIFVPDIIIEEWNNGKKEVIKEKLNQFEKIKDSIPKDMNNLTEAIADSYNHNFKLLRRITNAEYLTRRIKFIDNLIKDATTINTKKFDIYENVINYAIKNKAPFFENKKKEVKDALIWYGIIDYFKNDEIYEKIIFISDNKKDFSNPSNPSELHSHLKKEARDNFLFTNNLKGLINDINKDGKYNFISNHIEPQNEIKKIYSDEYYIECLFCKEEVHKDINVIQKGRNYHFKCPHCDKSWDSGEDIHDSIMSLYN